MKIKNFEVLNSKAVRQILKLLRQQWGYEGNIDCAFLQRENDIFLSAKDIDRIDLMELNVNSLGLYFGELRHEQLRLSVEGSQIIGKKAKKNVVELDDSQLKQWLAGEDVGLAATNCENNSYAIVRHNSDFFSCGRIKDGKLINFVPKARRFNLNC